MGFMRGCADIEDDQGCVNDDDAHTCRCMDPLCNEGWESAGSSTGTPNTTPQVPKIKCYKCDSTAAEQECTEDSYGTEVDCPDTFGCSISKTIAGDGSQGMMRDCSSEKDTICDTVDNPSDVIVIQSSVMQTGLQQGRPPNLRMEQQSQLL